MPRAALAALASAALLTAPAAAQDVFGAYVQVHGGAFFQTGDELQLGDGPVQVDVALDPDLGYAVGGLLGYEVGLGLSVEVEATLRSNDVDFEDEARGRSTELGEEESLAVMLNGVYTFAVPFLADPYVGAGLGYVKPAGDADEFEGTFAYQAKAGLAWPVGIGSVITEASYLGTGGLEAEDGGAELDYGGVSAMVGYRFGF